RVAVGQRLLDRCGLGALRLEHRLEPVLQRHQPLGQRQLLVGAHDAVGNMAQTVPFGVDDAPSGQPQSRVQPDHAHRPASRRALSMAQAVSMDQAVSRSMTSSAISKLAETCCTSSLSSSASSSLKRVVACSSLTGMVVSGFQVSRASCGSPYFPVSASRTSEKSSGAQTTSWASAEASTSLAPASAAASNIASAPATDAG